MIPPNALARVEAWFWENFERRGELGASVSIWRDGREILSLAGGHLDRRRECPWTAETPVLVWSATKGPAAACLLHALARQGERLDGRVAAVWPEFAQAGKGGITFAELLSHRAGLAALDAAASMFDHEAVAAALAAQAPNRGSGEGPGGGHGYHPRTFGFLLDELVRRLEGIPLGEYWRTWFGTPLDLDFWIGLPPERLEPVSPVYPARIPAKAPLPGPAEAPDAPFYQALADPRSLTARAFASPRGLNSVASMNSPEARQASFPAFGGIGTARAMAKFYAMLAGGGSMDGLRLFDSIAPMTTTLASGPDRVLLRETAFAAGFMRDPVDADGAKLRQLFGPSLTAFGQPGAGGSHAFADPENGIAFAYVMNQMDPGVMPGEKALGLVRALYSGGR